MTEEKAFFIKALSDHLNLNKTVIEKDLDWIEIRRLAKVHHVEGIIYYQCRDMIPEEIRKDFELYSNVALFYYTNRKNEIKRIEKTFNENGVQYFLLKGLDIAKYYPVPYLRTMGDNDIVVKPNDKLKAQELLLSLGFERREYYNSHEWVFRKNNMYYELHDRLIYPQVINHTPVVEFFNNCWPFANNGNIDVNFHFLFLIIHLRKHFMNTGVGIRQFFDIAVMIRNEKDLDWLWIDEKLNELGLSTFANTCMAFIKEWFHVSPLHLRDDINPLFFEYSTEKILEDGVFGFENAGNAKNHIINVARRSQMHGIEVAKYLVSVVFPSYKSLILNKRYSFLQQRSYLLPLAWLSRLFYGVLNIRQTIGIMSKFIVKPSEIMEKDRFLKDWGL